MSPDNRPGPPAVYAALGDSISIDEYAGGPGLGGASLFAHNRDDTFPHWRGRDLATIHPRLRYQLFAVDGGTTETVLDHQLPQLERSGAAPAVVTLTIGGNDLLGVYGDTPPARSLLAVVRRQVGQTLRRLRPLMRTRTTRSLWAASTTPATAPATPPTSACHRGPPSSTFSPSSTPNSPR